MIDAVIFDKDGTLFDFRASWGGWTKRLLEELAGGDAQVLTALAGAARFDLATLDFTSLNIDDVQLEDGLGQIQTNDGQICSRLHGGASSLGGC